jgi:hypothetical protein
MSTTDCPRPDKGAGEIPVPQRGDHIRAGLPGRPHHDGIYLGDGSVIHLVGTTGEGKTGARVQIGTLAQFADGRPVSVRHYASSQDPEAVIARAMSRLGEGNYNLIFNNCQHFARWCATGDHLSEQVNSAVAVTGTIATPLIAAAAGTSLIGSAGLVYGLSGPGIMSGLAAYGALIGGGAVAGITVLSSVPALASIAFTSHALSDDGDLPDNERTARTAGRLGSLGGAIAGSIASVAAVNALGLPGLSAAGISSGLAALGAVFNGGMTAGTICAVAAPAITAAILGYAAYRLIMWLSAEDLTAPRAPAAA